jgi:hypothetical protein
MVEEPSHVKQLSLNHMCKIGLTAAEMALCGNLGPKSQNFFPLVSD